MGERQTEDLKVPGSIPGGGTFFVLLSTFTVSIAFSFTYTVRHLGREVKAADSKSAGLCPREFESHRCRAFVPQLAERSAVNRQVPGSIPGEGAFLLIRSVLRVE